MKSEFWGITTYFNPLGYKSRLNNFRTFRERLQLPLLVIELSFNNNFDLDSSYGEIVIHKSSNSIMWQKERLLNIALSHLPNYVKHIAWLDCDVIFPNLDWVDKTAKLLKNYKLIQLFSRLYDLPQTFSDFSSLSLDKPTGFSIIHNLDSRKLSPEDFRPTTTPGMRRALFGLAWAANFKVISKHGFYDAMILGSGDRALTCAALGRFKDFIETAHLDTIRASHYLNWARQFYNEIRGEVTYLDSDLYHLWHGELVNRNYIERHIQLSKFRFNPVKDIKLNEHNCWEWSTSDNALKMMVANYFALRREDG